MIIAISGASGVGKTHTLKTLSKTNPNNTQIYHFDDMGIPDWSKIKDHKKWQKDATEDWINKLVKIAKEKNVHVLFEGSTEIKFYEESFAKNQYTDYQILLFDCSENTMKQRLIKRKQPELYTEDMVNWLNYLRREAISRNVEIVKTDEITLQEITQLIKTKLV